MRSQNPTKPAPSEHPVNGIADLTHSFFCLLNKVENDTNLKPVLGEHAAQMVQLLDATRREHYNAFTANPAERKASSQALVSYGTERGTAAKRAHMHATQVIDILVLVFGFRRYLANTHPGNKSTQVGSYRKLLSAMIRKAINLPRTQKAPGSQNAAPTYFSTELGLEIDNIVTHLQAATQRGFALVGVGSLKNPGYDIVNHVQTRIRIMEQRYHDRRGSAIFCRRVLGDENYSALGEQTMRLTSNKHSDRAQHLQHVRLPSLVKQLVAGQPDTDRQASWGALLDSLQRLSHCHRALDSSRGSHDGDSQEPAAFHSIALEKNPSQGFGEHKLYLESLTRRGVNKAARALGRTTNLTPLRVASSVSVRADAFSWEAYEPLDLSQLVVENVSFSGNVLEDVNATQTHFRQVRFIDGFVFDGEYEGATFTDCTIDGASMTDFPDGATFTNCRFKNLKGALNGKGNQFKQCTFEFSQNSADFERSTVVECTFKGQSQTLNFTQAKVIACDFSQFAMTKLFASLARIKNCSAPKNALAMEVLAAGAILTGELVNDRNYTRPAPEPAYRSKRGLQFGEDPSDDDEHDTSTTEQAVIDLSSSSSDEDRGGVFGLSSSDDGSDDSAFGFGTDMGDDTGRKSSSSNSGLSFCDALKSKLTKGSQVEIDGLQLPCAKVVSKITSLKGVIKHLIEEAAIERDQKSQQGASSMLRNRSNVALILLEHLINIIIALVPTLTLDKAKNAVSIKRASEFAHLLRTMLKGFKIPTIASSEMMQINPQVFEKAIEYTREALHTFAGTLKARMASAPKSPVRPKVTRGPEVAADSLRPLMPVTEPQSASSSAAAAAESTASSTSTALVERVVERYSQLFELVTDAPLHQKRVSVVKAWHRDHEEGGRINVIKELPSELQAGIMEAFQSVLPFTGIESFATLNDQGEVSITHAIPSSVAKATGILLKQAEASDDHRVDPDPAESDPSSGKGEETVSARLSV